MLGLPGMSVGRPSVSLPLSAKPTADRHVEEIACEGKA
jgi:hypothetical protein